jgi:hypothetical protein
MVRSQECDLGLRNMDLQWGDGVAKADWRPVSLMTNDKWVVSLGKGLYQLCFQELQYDSNMTQKGCLLYMKMLNAVELQTA